MTAAVKIPFINDTPIHRPFHGFFSTFDKDQLAKFIDNARINKLAEFESDMSETSEDIAPKSREILQTFAWCRGTNLPLTIQTSIRFGDFAEPCLYEFSSYHSQTWQSTDFKALFLVVSMDLR